jgi:DNA repair protein RecN (Recombination protein N)
VTHLPQVAAFAHHHFVVTKDDDGTITSSSVVELGEDNRVDELARMLAGQEDSAAAQAHARELLELARS